MSPIVETPSLSNTGSQVVPLFVVFHTPPDAVPTYTMFGLLSTTAKSSMRPPITAGPISRNSRFLNLSVGFCGLPGAPGVLTVAASTNTIQARILRSVLHVCFISISSRARSGILPLSGVLRIKCFWKGQPTLCRQTRSTVPTFHGVHFASFPACFPSNCAALLACKSLRPHARLSSRSHRSHALLESSLFLGSDSCCDASFSHPGGASRRGFHAFHLHRRSSTDRPALAGQRRRRRARSENANAPGRRHHRRWRRGHSLR